MLCQQQKIAQVHNNLTNELAVGSHSESVLCASEHMWIFAFIDVGFS